VSREGRISEVARRAGNGEGSRMATLTIHVDDDLARHVEEAARREHKSVSEWVKERVKSFTNPAPIDADEPVASESHLGLEDFPQFPEANLKHETFSGDVIYDERGR